MLFSLLLVSVSIVSQATTAADAPDQTSRQTGDAPAGQAPVFVSQRNLMLEMLEHSKQHKPRLPLPEPSAADLAKGSTGSLGLVNNGLMRRFYLPGEWSGAAFPRTAQDGAVSYRTKTELFWIISRLNQCTYCLGHQETKLATAGLSESEIASLDGDWADASPGVRAARQLAVWKTRTPEKPVPEAIWTALATEFNGVQQSEILLAIANYNAMNRWTGPLNIPQEKHREYRSSLSPELQNKPSQLNKDQKTGWNKRVLPDFSDWIKMVSEKSDSRRFMFEPDSVAGQEPVHMRLLKSQGVSGEARIQSWRKALSTEPPTDDFPIPALLRGKILWVCARLDNAPFAASDARQMLKSLDVKDAELERLENLSETGQIDEPTRQALKLATLITTNPAWVGDHDINEVRKHWGDRATAQIIELSCIAAAIDRLCP